MTSAHPEIRQKLDRWLTTLIRAKGSDLHLKTGSPVHARVKGNIVLLSKEITGPESIRELTRYLMGKAYTDFEKTDEYDGAYSMNENYRFRVNIYRHLNGISIACRLIPPVIRSIDSLNLPRTIHKLTDLRRGLVLVTGSTGSGKTTTLASIVHEINRKHPYHIITIENPVEYIFHDEKSIIEQRELGSHTASFHSALRASMREDPDVIVVGEVRDLKTAQAVLEAADTGHLVFATMHTLDVRETVDRLIAIFPVDEQNRVSVTLAATIEAIVSQRLIKNVEGEMIPAVEMMFKSPLVSELIRSRRENEIPDALEKESHSYGSILFDRSLFNLTLANKITEEQAFRYATNKNDLRLMFTLSKEYQRRRSSKEREQTVSLKNE